MITARPAAATGVRMGAMSRSHGRTTPTAPRISRAPMVLNSGSVRSWAKDVLGGRSGGRVGEPVVLELGETGSEEGCRQHPLGDPQGDVHGFS
jgi:hypothetical protein